MTSAPFLTCAIAYYGMMFGMFIFNIYLPVYLKVMHGLESTQVG